MTERLYYQDAYTTKFKAKVIERLRHNGRPAVVLDQTYFYPTSGGQPHDRGWMNETGVTNVFFRDADEAIVHLLADELWSDEVVAAIDWSRRFDHMQQHTGQHVLSQAFIRVAEAETAGFHLGSEGCTIDLHTHELMAAQVEQAERLANEIIWENRPVLVRMVSPEEAAGLWLRKIPAAVHGRLRLVEIEEFDLTACGGTHVASTGEIGLIKIIKLERRGKALRVVFLCGRRALDDYRQKNSIVNRLTTELTTGPAELERAVVGLREEARESRQVIRQQQSRLLALEADELLEQASKVGKITVVSQVFTDRQPGELRALANQLVRNPGTVALCGLAGPTAQLIFARSEDAPGEMNQLIKQALQLLGIAGGGGSASFAQGGGPAADGPRISQALGRAERLLRAQIMSDER